MFPTSGSDLTGVPVTMMQALTDDPEHAAALKVQALEVADESPENCFMGMPVATLVNAR